MKNRAMKNRVQTGSGMKHLDTVKTIFGDSPGVPVAHVRADSNLPGSVPEDDDISARHVAIVGSLAEFVQEKLDP